MTKRKLTPIIPTYDDIDQSVVWSSEPDRRTRPTHYMSPLTQKADRFNHAVLEAQQQLLSEGKPDTAQSLNTVLNLPAASAARLYDLVRMDGGEV